MSEAFVYRLMDERDALKDKYVKLTNFLESGDSDGLTFEEVVDLQTQHFHMGEYLRVLEHRIKRYS